MHAGVGGIPGFDDDVVEFVAEELVNDALVLAVNLEEVGQRAYGGHSVGVLLVGAGLENVANGVSGVAVLADEGFEGVAPACEGRDFAAQLIAATLGLGFFAAAGFDLEAGFGDLGFETLQALGDGLEGHLYLATLQAEGFELVPGDVGVGEETLGFALEAGEGGCSLGLFVPGLGGALHQLHGGAAVLLGLLLGGGEGTNCLLCLSLLALRGFAGVSGFGGGVLEEAAVLFEFSSETGKLLAGLGEIVSAGGETAGELGDAVGVGGGARGDALEFNGGLVGLRSRVADLLVEGVAVADALGVLGVHGLDGRGLRVDLSGEEGDPFRGGG